MRVKSRYPMGAEILDTEVGDMLVHSGRKFVVFGDTHSQGMWAEAILQRPSNDNCVDNTSPPLAQSERLFP